MRAAKQLTKRTTQFASSEVQKEIPQELLPYFYALADCSKQKQWVTDIYYGKIVPYIENLIKKDTFHKDALSIDDLCALKAYYYKQKANYTQIERHRLIHLRNGIKICDKLQQEIEKSYFSSIYHKKDGFTMDSFLPSNFKKHLQFILEVQLFIFIENQLSLIAEKTQDQKENQKITALQQWIKKELDAKKPNRPVVSSHKDHLVSVKPNTYVYFINGSHHLFLLYQLEYLNMKKFVVDWISWKDYFEKNKYSINDLLSCFTASLTSLGFGLLGFAFLPYRILRTIVNQLTGYISIEFKNFLIRQFPFMTKWKIWHPMSFLFQISVYLGLAVLFGLPMLPLPLISLTNLFSSLHLLWMPAFYCATIFGAIGFSKLFRNQSISDSIEQSSSINRLSAEPKFFLKLPRHNRYSIQYDLKNELPSADNLALALPKLKKRR